MEILLVFIKTVKNNSAPLHMSEFIISDVLVEMQLT